MKVKIVYPGTEHEELDAVPDQVRPRTVELRQHAGLIPLAPGDRLTIDQSGDAIAVVHLEPLYTYEVHMAMPSDLVAGRALPNGHPSRRKIADLAAGWRRDGYVTQLTTFTFLVSSQSRRWLDEQVLSHRYVAHHRRVRTPDLKMDLAVAVAHPDLDGRGGGPWA